MIETKQNEDMAKVATITFGGGSLRMYAGYRKDIGTSIGTLHLDTCTPQPIGSKQLISPKYSTHDRDHEIVMYFENIASVDEFIKALQDVKKSMVLGYVGYGSEIDLRLSKIQDLIIGIAEWCTTNNLNSRTDELYDYVTRLTEWGETTKQEFTEMLTSISADIKNLYFNTLVPPHITQFAAAIAEIEKLLEIVEEL